VLFKIRLRVMLMTFSPFGQAKTQNAPPFSRRRKRRGDHAPYISGTTAAKD
jgi:hypothetical protein